MPAQVCRARTGHGVSALWAAPAPHRLPEYGRAQAMSQISPQAN
ncbi:hypothetical protein [Nocardia sp. IFM 10818]